MEYSVKELIDLLFVTDEQERIEAKKSSEIGKSIMETVCAYANEPGLGGGYLLLGVEPALEKESGYNICGLSDPDKILNDLQSNCRTQFNNSCAYLKEKRKVEDFYYLEDLINLKKLFLRYDVPKKKDLTTNEVVINWVWEASGRTISQVSANEIKPAFRQHCKNSDSIDVKKKIDNTLEFYCFALSETFHSNEK